MRRWIWLALVKVATVRQETEGEAPMEMVVAGGGRVLSANIGQVIMRLEDQTRARMAELRESLSAQGVVGEEIEERLAAEERRVLAETQRALRALYLMEAIAAKHELQVQQADLLTELRAIAERNGAPLDEVRKYYQEQGLFGQLAMELMERKVRSFLREAADIRLA
jgi:FKBP-type peptidyl-prolyl cis-trans isomerase (trigger factor)